MGVLAAADATAAALTFLRAHTAVTAALAGGRCGGVNAPPYPCLAVTDIDADDRDLRWLAAVVLQLDAVGDLDGRPGKPALRSLAYTAAEALAEMPSAGVVAGVVVTAVTSASGVRWSPLANRQPRYVASLRVHWHPARA